MNEPKFNYVVGIALVVLLVLVVYLGGKMKTVENAVIDLDGRLAGLEGLVGEAALPEELLLPEGFEATPEDAALFDYLYGGLEGAPIEDVPLEAEDLGAYSWGAFDDYYDEYYDDGGYDYYGY